MRKALVSALSLLGFVSLISLVIWLMPGSFPQKGVVFLGFENPEAEELVVIVRRPGGKISPGLHLPDVCFPISEGAQGCTVGDECPEFIIDYNCGAVGRRYRYILGW